MIPGILYISVTDSLSMEQLTVCRELYNMSTRYDSAENYIKAARKFMEGAGVPCDERLKKICS